MAFDSFITSDGENLLNQVNQIAKLTVRNQDGPYEPNWKEINPLTYDGPMPTDDVNTSVHFGGNSGRVSRNPVPDTFSLDFTHININTSAHQAEMAAKAGDSEKKNGTGSYTYEINDKGEITYKKPDGSKCPVTEFRRMAGEVAFKKAQEEAKAKKAQA